MGCGGFMVKKTFDISVIAYLLNRHPDELKKIIQTADQDESFQLFSAFPSDSKDDHQQ